MQAINDLEGGDATTPLRKAVLATGQTLAPDEAYATLRGMRTLHLRLERHQENTLQVAQWLQNHDNVQRVLNPALADHPGHAIWKRDASGINGLLTAVFSAEVDVSRFLNALRLFAIGSSWGGFESLAKTVTPRHDYLASNNLAEGGVVRLHVGLEHVSDILEDLEQAMVAALR
jgi:cystathionine beta-lyase